MLSDRCEEGKFGYHNVFLYDKYTGTKQDKPAAYLDSAVDKAICKW